MKKKTPRRYHALFVVPFLFLFKVRMPVTARDNSTANSTEFCLSSPRIFKRSTMGRCLFFSLELVFPLVIT